MSVNWMSSTYCADESLNSRFSVTVQNNYAFTLENLPENLVWKKIIIS